MAYQDADYTAWLLQKETCWVYFFIQKSLLFSLWLYRYSLVLKQWNRGSIFCFLLLTLLCCLSELTGRFGCVGFVGFFFLFQEELLKCCCGLGFNLSLLLALKEKKKMTTAAEITIWGWGLYWMICLSPQCAAIPVCIYLVIFLWSIPCSSLDIGHWITSRKCCNMLQVNLLFKASIVKQGAWTQLSQSNVCL